MPPHPRWIITIIIIIPNPAQALPQPQADTAECVGQLVLNLEIPVETLKMKTKCWPIAAWHSLWDVNSRVFGRDDHKPIAIALAVWPSLHLGTGTVFVFSNPGIGKYKHWTPPGFHLFITRLWWPPHVVGFKYIAFPWLNDVGTPSNGFNGQKWPQWKIYVCCMTCKAWGPHLCSWLLWCHCGRHPWCRSGMGMDGWDHSERKGTSPPWSNMDTCVPAGNSQALGFQPAWCPSPLDRSGFLHGELGVVAVQVIWCPHLKLHSTPQHSNKKPKTSRVEHHWSRISTSIHLPKSSFNQFLNMVLLMFEVW